MEQVHHGSATTTEVARSAILRSQASLPEVGREFGISPKMVAKCHKRATLRIEREAVLLDSRAVGSTASVAGGHKVGMGLRFACLGPAAAIPGTALRVGSLDRPPAARVRAEPASESRSVPPRTDALREPAL